MKILYLAALPEEFSFEGGLAEQPLGRSLAHHLSTEHELRVRGAIAQADSPVLQDDVSSSIVVADELEEFDAVYMEGGWNRSYAADPGRFPLELAESYVRRGGQLIVADESWPNDLMMGAQLAEAADLFGASFEIRKVGRKEGVSYLEDAGHREKFGTRYFTREMRYVAGWLKPALEGIDSILADDAVELRIEGAGCAACGNANTDVLVEGVVWKHESLTPWASVNACGLGHAVLIAADVSNDDLVDTCPDNAKWISNLIALLAERSQETAGWTAPVQQQKPVDIPSLHPSISAASGVQFANRHYDEAVFAALKAVEHRVQTLTGSRDSGKTLMANIFNEKSAALDIAHDQADGRQRADEAEGFKFLFMGATQGLRNPRAHGAHLHTEEQEAIEMLATASLLMRALDRAEKRLP